MEYKKTLNQIKTLLSMDVNLSKMKLKDGITTIEAEEFAADFSVGIVTEEGIVPLPAGEYELEDGNVIVVMQEGIIGEVKKMEAKEDMPKEDDKPMMEDEKMEAEAATPKRVVESVSKETFFAEIEKLRAEFSAIKAENENLKAELEKVELSAQENEAGANVISHNPEGAKVETYKFGNNRKSGTIDRVYTKLFN